MKSPKSPVQPSHKDSSDMNQASTAQLIESLQQQLAQAQDKERRALADYQNLVRRNQADRSRFMSLATQEAVENFLEPYINLVRASQQLSDQGVLMVAQQFKQALVSQGLEEIPVLGQEFNVEIMEVVETRGQGGLVIEVLEPGFSLNGQVVRHAKVVLG